MIGIHNSKGLFSDRWIAYCTANGIPFKIIDCFSTDIVSQLSDCDTVMWHFNHKGPRESKFAKQLLFALESSGKKVFPDFNTVWHFDDKVAQKYLLEAINAPLAPSFVFYSKQEVTQWIDNTSFPKVFKLRNGAGSDNVRLVSSREEALRLISKAFGRGFRQYNALDNLRERIRKYNTSRTNLWDVVRGLVRLFVTTRYDRVTPRESGYIYFQDFIPGNDHDIRVVVIGDKAFAIKRMVRRNDFRASGSGEILYERDLFDVGTIGLSFDISSKLGFQCMAYDYVYLERQPILVEISYGFSKEGYDLCPGFWDSNLNWHEGSFNPYGWMVENLLQRVQKNQPR